MHSITETKFYKLYPKASPGLYKEIIELAPLAGIKTKEQLAKFIAQCAHESGGFQKFSESLNYSVDGLLKVFPRYFSKELAERFGYKKDATGKIIRKADQVAIANRVYSDQVRKSLGSKSLMGNTSQGDGWKYRGRGLIQLTGKSNYEKFSNWLNDPEVFQNPDKILSSNKLIVLTAIWFWKENNLAQISDFTLLSKRVNGGTIGLNERIHEYQKLMA